MTPRQRLCTASLASMVTLMAACTAPSTRPPAPPPAQVATPPAAPVVADITPSAAPPIVLAAEPDDSPWPRLRRSFAMQRCDYSPQVEHWARYYTKNPGPFVASWKQAMPFLLIVVDEIEKRGLPGEFAMLPYVESSYQPLATRGDRPAGMWQLVPDTAHLAGLEVGADYDARLDARASTTAALDLLQRYYREFADWRLANMAFNSGEFRVRKLLDERDARTLSPADLGALAFNPSTHEHLDRLLALACIVEDPQRFGVSLPEPQGDDHLQALNLQTGMDLRLVARLAGSDIDEVKRWNAGYRRNRMASRSTYTLMLPSTRIERFNAAAADIPVAWWSDWQEQRAPHAGSIKAWAEQVGIPVNVLAVANATSESGSVRLKSRLLLPGREADPPREREVQQRPRVHVIAAGDTLSRIAHRYDIPLKDLRRWNPRASGTLRLGDKLRLGVADSG
jgi:membrane-bound lytic murein transglycosylase D